MALYEAEMFLRMQQMTADTVTNKEIFYAPDAAERVVSLLRRFGGSESVRLPLKLDAAALSRAREHFMSEAGCSFPDKAGSFYRSGVRPWSG